MRPRPTDVRVEPFRGATPEGRRGPPIPRDLGRTQLRHRAGNQDCGEHQRQRDGEGIQHGLEGTGMPRCTRERAWHFWLKSGAERASTPRVMCMRRTLLIDAVGAVIEIDGSSLTDDGWAAVEHAWSGAGVDTDAGRPVGDGQGARNGHHRVDARIAVHRRDPRRAEAESGRGPLAARRRARRRTRAGSWCLSGRRAVARRPRHVSSAGTSGMSPTSRSASRPMARCCRIASRCPIIPAFISMAMRSRSAVTVVNRSSHSSTGRPGPRPARRPRPGSTAAAAPIEPSSERAGPRPGVTAPVSSARAAMARWSRARSPERATTS